VDGGKAIYVEGKAVHELQAEPESEPGRPSDRARAPEAPATGEGTGSGNGGLSPEEPLPGPGEEPWPF
jgi:hypothetical protein